MITVDASQFACSGILSQIIDGEDKPIAYVSKCFNKAELNKPIIEKELLAIYFSIGIFRPYIYGTHFTVRSDHKPLIYLYNLKNPTSKLTRIRLELEEYNFTIQYIRGKHNVCADALSRIKLSDIKSSSSTEQILAITRSMTRNQNSNSNTKKNEIQETNTMPQLFNGSYHKKIPRIKINICEKDSFNVHIKIYMGHKLQNELKIETKKLELDSILGMIGRSSIFKNIKHAQINDEEDIFKYFSKEKFRKECEHHLHGLTISLLKRPPKIMNENEKFELMTKYHTDPIQGGHCGQKALYSKLRTNFYWKDMNKYVAKFIRNCKECMLCKPKRKTIEKLTWTSTPIKPFDVIIIDTIGPLQKSDSSNVYAVTMIDELSKYLIVTPVESKDATTVAKAIFNDLILKFGIPKSIRTDCGTEYRNAIISELCSMLKIKHDFSTPHHHETLGTIERNHRNVNEYLRAYLNDNNWDILLHYFTFCYNTSPHGTFEYKYTPFEIIFGRKCNISEVLSENIEPIYNVDDFVKISKYNLQIAQSAARKLIDKMKIRNKEFYDKKANPINVRVGDSVILRNEPYKKHGKKYAGPYTVTGVSHPNVTINIKDKQYTTHKNRILLANK